MLQIKISAGLLASPSFTFSGFAFEDPCLEGLNVQSRMLATESAHDVLRFNNAFVVGFADHARLASVCLRSVIFGRGPLAAYSCKRQHLC